MGLSNPQYESIMRGYNRRQIEQKHLQDRRVEEIYEKIPAIREINAEIGEAALRSARELLDGDDAAVERLREKIADLKEQREVLLASKGYPADYMELHYTCPDCRDTGYVDGRKCHCFREQEINLLYRQSNLKDILEEENFAHFRLDYYDDTKTDARTGLTARAYMRGVESRCREYVEQFDRKKGNILFTGATGLGKTFLAHCIAGELLNRSRSVVALQAADLFDLFSRARFDRDSQEDERGKTQFLMECDLLIIDDLGTELGNSFTVSQLFHVVNDRLINGRGTIITTNLSMNALRDEFTERVTSRIISGYDIIPLYGDDIRIRKRMLQP